MGSAVSAVDAPLADAAVGSSTGGGFVDGAKKVAQSVSSFLPHNQDGSLNVGSLVDKGLGAAQVLNAAHLQKQSSDYAKNAYATANESYGARAPLRVAGIEGMLHPQTADLSSLSHIPGNPFAKKPRAAQSPTGVAPISIPPVHAAVPGGY